MPFYLLIFSFILLNAIRIRGHLSYKGIDMKDRHLEVIERALEGSETNREAIKYTFENGHTLTTDRPLKHDQELSLKRKHGFIVDVKKVKSI